MALNPHHLRPSTACVVCGAPIDAAYGQMHQRTPTPEENDKHQQYNTFLCRFITEGYYIDYRLPKTWRTAWK